MLHYALNVVSSSHDNDNDTLRAQTDRSPQRGRALRRRPYHSRWFGARKDSHSKSFQALRLQAHDA